MDARALTIDVDAGRGRRSPPKIVQSDIFRDGGALCPSIGRWNQHEPEVRTQIIFGCLTSGELYPIDRVNAVQDSDG